MPVDLNEVIILESEKSRSNVSIERLNKRAELISELRKLPKEAFTEVQYLQPQINCFNRCSFCSQGAGKTVWQLGLSELEDLISSIKTVAIEVASTQGIIPESNIVNHRGTFHENFIMPPTGLLGYERIHRPGVIFPYLDNDISSYKYLDRFIQLLDEDLGVKVRISTTGYSRKNTQLQEVHEKINSSLKHTFAGIRFSITPYTFGYTEQGENLGITNREEFKLDIINLFRTYKPLVEYLGPSKSSACAELRFKPLVNSKVELSEYRIDGHHIIICGPYLLISVNKNVNISKSNIIDLEGQWPVFDSTGEEFLMLQSEIINSDVELQNKVIEQVINYLRTEESNKINFNELLTRIDNIINSENLKLTIANLFLLENEEGPYYATDPKIKEDGYYAKQFYFRTEKRKKSGYVDSERYFLNALIEYKRVLGLSRQEEFTEATDNDVQEVINLLNKMCESTQLYDTYAAKHLENSVIPLVEFYRDILKEAGYEARFFFSKHFTVDTGIIVNQGRALSQFRGLVSKENLPLTPQEERGYGNFSYSSLRGFVWRWSLTPHVFNKITKASIGMKNTINSSSPGIEITKLDCRNLMPVKINDRQYSYKISDLALERYDIGDLNLAPIIPGEVETKLVKQGAVNV